ncbi:TRP-like family, partial [Pilobolus umbonatus]
MIGLFQASGLAQLIVALLIEVVLFVSIYLKFPYVQQQMNIQQLIFSATRFIILMLNIAYLPNIKASVMAKQYIGYIQLVIHCLIYLLSLILLMRNATVLLLGLREELNDSGKPSIRIAFWKNRQGQHPRE